MNAVRSGPVDTRLDAGPRRATRVLAALLIPVGPAAVAVLRYVLPYNTTDDTATVMSKVAAAPDSQSWVLWLGLAAVLTLVPGTLWVGGLTQPRAPRLTAAALLLLVPGYLALPWLTSADILAWSGASAGLDPARVTRLAETAHPTVVVAEILFVVGHVLGTILLGLAMWASRVVPRWAAVLTVVSQPLHFVAAVILASHPLDLAAWGMQALGFAASAYALVRRADDEGLSAA
jgi:hypothetical protein